MKIHFTKDQKTFAIRRPTERDAEQIINYSKILFASTDQVLTMGKNTRFQLPTKKRGSTTLTQIQMRCFW
jgi:hypothetical protein